MFIALSGLIHLPKLNFNAVAKFCLFVKNEHNAIPFSHACGLGQSDAGDFILF